MAEATRPRLEFPWKQAQGQKTNPKPSLSCVALRSPQKQKQKKSKHDHGPLAYSNRGAPFCTQPAPHTLILHTIGTITGVQKPSNRALPGFKPPLTQASFKVKFSRLPPSVPPCTLPTIPTHSRRHHATPACRGGGQQRAVGRLRGLLRWLRLWLRLRGQLPLQQPPERSSR